MFNWSLHKANLWAKPIRAYKEQWRTITSLADNRRTRAWKYKVEHVHVIWVQHMLHILTQCACMYLFNTIMFINKNDETPLMEVGVMWKGEPIGILDKAKGKGEFASSSRGASMDWRESSIRFLWKLLSLLFAITFLFACTKLMAVARLEKYSCRVLHTHVPYEYNMPQATPSA